MIGRFHVDLNAIPAMAGQAMRLPMIFWQDRNKQSVLNITGYSAKCTLLDVDGNVLVAATSANGGITIVGASGTANVDSSGMSPAHAAIPAGTHSYAYELYNASGVLEFYMTGEWPYDPDLSP